MRIDVGIAANASPLLTCSLNVVILLCHLGSSVVWINSTPHLVKQLCCCGTGECREGANMVLEVAMARLKGFHVAEIAEVKCSNPCGAPAKSCQSTQTSLFGNVLPILSALGGRISIKNIYLFLPSLPVVNVESFLIRQETSFFAVAAFLSYAPPFTCCFSQ